MAYDPLAVLSLYRQVLAAAFMPRFESRPQRTCRAMPLLGSMPQSQKAEDDEGPPDHTARGARDREGSVIVPLACPLELDRPVTRCTRGAMAIGRRSGDVVHATMPPDT